MISQPRQMPQNKTSKFPINTKKKLIAFRKSYKFKRSQRRLNKLILFRVMDTQRRVLRVLNRNSLSDNLRQGRNFCLTPFYYL